MWETGTTDAKTCKEKKKPERAQKPEAISFLLFLVWHNTKRTSERAILTPPGIYTEFEVFVSSTHKKTTDSLVFSRQAATMKELHGD
jgi:hypothetical protein